jgi:hypothetical protein
MTHHFATSWLRSLSTKLEALVEWTFAAGRKDSGTTHRNLFREFFSAPFQKTLALVDEAKKTEFLACIERNLYKFEAQTQQFPLGCLCALLEHGKDSARTQEKFAAWVEFLFGRLRSEPQSQEVGNDVMEVVLSPQFQKFLPFMGDPLKERLADGLGEHLSKLDEGLRQKVMESVPVIVVRVEQLVAACTDELNTWLCSAPRYPATPTALADALAKMEHPLVKFFASVKDTAKKESFLVAVALVLQSIRTRFRWMCLVEPELETSYSVLRQRLFFVDGQGAVMEMWLSSRLKKYNHEVTSQANSLILGDPNKREVLKFRLQAIFPERLPNDPNASWVPLDGPTKVSEILLTWLRESSDNFLCPRHTLARETIAGILNRLGGLFEIENGCQRARLQLSAVSTAKFPPLPPSGIGSGPGIMVAYQGQQKTDKPSIEADNIIDLLLNEALQDAESPEDRARVRKVAHGVYEVGNNEVTFHVLSGRLFVYRVGDVVRHCPVKTLLQEEGIVSLPAPVVLDQPIAGNTMPTSSSQSPGGITPVTTPAISGAADTSSVAKIAVMAAQISAGVMTTTTTPAPQASNPFGSQKGPPDQQHKSDAQALMSKRVEAATRAMDVSKQIVRRSLDFQDDKRLRKVLT